MLPLLAFQLSLALDSVCGSQTKPAEVAVIPSSFASSSAFTIRRGGLPEAKGLVEVSGTLQYALPLLVADTIRFRRGSHLVLTQPAGSRFELSIIARSIEVEDSSDPGEITWGPGQLPGIPRWWVEPASPGSSGAESTAGTEGRAGASGTPGLPGRSGPVITIIVDQVRGLPNFVLCGQSGGPGGAGQAGGEGGRGGSGNSASQNAFNCNRGAGNGGPGGPGGKGGPGGNGGLGGDGGSLVLLTLESRNMSPILIRAVTQGGAGGIAGPGGPGGRGGAGGAGGFEQLPWCRGSGGRGRDGERGADGPTGEPGMHGKPGTASLGYLDQKQLRMLFLGAK